VQMGPEQECVSCKISTVCTANRNKATHTGGTYTVEYIFIDILHPIMNAGLTKSMTFTFYLILVDAFNQYACIYGILEKSSLALIDTLT
jgi:hypothetical protein